VEFVINLDKIIYQLAKNNFLKRLFFFSALPSNMPTEEK